MVEVTDEDSPSRSHKSSNSSSEKDSMYRSSMLKLKMLAEYKLNS